MKKHFEVCANMFSNNVYEITIKRTYFGIPLIVVSIEGYIVPNDNDDYLVQSYANILANAYRKVKILNLLSNKLPRRKV